MATYIGPAYREPLLGLKRLPGLIERHVDLQAGFPVIPEPGECEACDILWLIEHGEGDRADNLYNLRDALEAREMEGE